MNAIAQQPELMPHFEEIEQFKLQIDALQAQLKKAESNKAQAEERLNRKVQQLEKILPLKECSEIVATLNYYWRHLHGEGFENVEIVNLVNFTLIELITAYNTLLIYSPEFIQFETGHEFIAAIYLTFHSRAKGEGDPRPLAYANGQLIFVAEESFKFQ